MSALQAPKKISRRQELRKDAVVTAYARVVDFYERNTRLVIGVLGVLAAVLLLFVGLKFYTAQQSEKAEELLGAISLVYEQGLYREALDGTAEQPGLLEIADRFGNTEEGNLARFYAADALFRLGEKEEARTYFRRFDKGDHYLGAAAYAGEAAVEEDMGNYEEAAELYRRAALVFENNLTSPDYLLSAARNFEKVDRYDAARDAYERIREDFPESEVAGGLEFYLTRLDALQEKL